jgi:hypothetical protein
MWRHRGQLLADDRRSESFSIYAKTGVVTNRYLGALLTIKLHVCIASAKVVHEVEVFWSSIRTCDGSMNASCSETGHLGHECSYDKELWSKLRH